MKGFFFRKGFPLRIVLVVWVCVFSWGIMAGESVAGEASGLPPLTLEQAVKTGLEKNPRMSASQFQSNAWAPRISQALSIKLNQEQITLQDFEPARDLPIERELEYWAQRSVGIFIVFLSALGHGDERTLERGRGLPDLLPWVEMAETSVNKRWRVGIAL